MKFLNLFLSFFNFVNCANPNDFVCLNDTFFMHFVTTNQFVINQCPPGLCFTRVPANKNPCIGKQRALEIDFGQSDNGDLPKPFGCFYNL